MAATGRPSPLQSPRAELTCGPAAGAVTGGRVGETGQSVDVSNNSTNISATNKVTTCS